MKLQKIEIYGFGNMVDQSYQLGPEMNIFRGDNGSGKTTIMNFILSIMFGFPNLRKKHTRNYDVNDNVIYGGRIYLAETRYGNVILIRTRQANKQQLSMIIEDGEEIQVNNFNDLWEGLSRDDYLAFFGFDEQELMNFVWEDEDKFSKSLVSLGVSGRQVLTEINPLLTSEADEIFLPNGKKPYLNQHLNSLEGNQERLDEAHKNEQEYFGLKTEQVQNKKELTTLLSKQEVEKEKNMQLQLAGQQSDSIVEHRQLAEELANYHFFDFPDDMELQWRESYNRLQQLEQDYEQLNSEDAEGNTISKMTDSMWWIEDNPNVASQMLSEARAYRDKVHQHGDLNQEIIEKRYEQKRLITALGVKTVEELPTDLAESERQEWQKRYATIDGRRVFYKNGKEDLASFQTRIQALKNEGDDLAVQLDNVVDKDANTLFRDLSIGLLIIGIALTISYFLADITVLIGSGIAAIVVGLILMIVGVAQNKNKKEKYKNLIEDYELDIRDIDQEVIELQHKYKVQEDQLSSLKEDTKTFMDDLDDLVQIRGGSDTFQGIVWLQNDYITEIKQLESEIASRLSDIGLDNYQRSHEEAWTQYEIKLSNRSISLDTVFQNFEDDYHSSRQLVADSGYSKQQQRDNIRRLNNVKQRIQRLKQERKELLQDYNQIDGSALVAAIRNESEMREKRNRFDILSSQVDPKLAHYQDSNMSIEEQKNTTQVRLQEIADDIQKLNEQNAAIATNMRNIEASGLVSGLQQRNEHYFDEAYDLAVEWAARKMAVSIFGSATVGQEGDVIQRVLDQANVYLIEISNNKFEELRYNNDTVEVLYQFEGKKNWLAVTQLSRGEKAMLFIAMRFAFLNAQLGQLELPIIIDEAFLHLDLQARDSIYKFLGKQAETKQIILFTIDHGVIDILPNSHLYNI